MQGLIAPAVPFARLTAQGVLTLELPFTRLTVCILYEF
jgi:hypothetical protein